MVLALALLCDLGQLPYLSEFTLTLRQALLEVRCVINSSH